MSPPPRRWAAVAFALALLSPLAEAPGLGAWGVRLPLLAAAAAALLLDGAALRPDRLGLAALAFLAVQGLSLTVAADPAGGVPPLVALFAGVVFFLHARSGRLPADFARSAAPLLLSMGGAAVAVLGLGQGALGREAVSTLGNRNYAGTLAAMVLPASLAFAFAPVPGRTRLLHGAATLLLGAFVVVTDSRAGVVAAAAGLLAVAVSVRRARVPAAILLLAVIAAPFAARGTRPLSPERMSTMIVRSEIWKGSGRMLADRPLLGAGLGGFSAAYPPYRSFGESRLSHLHETRGFKEVEDAHSSWVQVAAESGPAGLLAFLAVAALGARAWVRRLRAGPEDPSVAGFGAGAVAFLVGGLFNALTAQAAHSALFWALLGMAAGAAPPGRPGAGSRLLAGAWGCLGVLAVIGGLATAAGELRFAAALATTDPELRIAALEDASPAWRAHEAKAGAYSVLGRFPEAAGEAREALRTRPNGAESMNTLAVALLRLGNPAEAEAVLRRALAAAPHCWRTHLNLGSLEYVRRNFAEAGRHYGLAEALVPAMPQIPYRRAETFLARDDVPGALEPLRRARALGFDVPPALRIDHPGKAGDPRLEEFFR